MARKKSATVEYLKGKTWSVCVRSSDAQLLEDLAVALGTAERRGLQILNALPPFAGVDAKPRKANAKKAELAQLDGGDSAVSRAVTMREGS